MLQLITRKTRTGRPTSEQPQSSEYHPPRHWMPDPVSRPGAMFYAFAGAALWEAAHAGYHYCKVAGLPALTEGAAAVGRFLAPLIG